jgi:predicted nucleic acid-binding protein
MERFLLDSDAVIDYLKGFPDSVALIRKLHADGDSLCVCDVVVAEVYSGLLPKDRGQARKLLSACEFLPTSAEMAERAGEWRYSHARRGLTISTTDALIAATAFSHGAKVVTGNAADYPMPEITIVQLPRSARSR